MEFNQMEWIKSSLEYLKEEKEKKEKELRGLEYNFKVALRELHFTIARYARVDESLLNKLDDLSKYPDAMHQLNYINSEISSFYNRMRTVAYLENLEKEQTKLNRIEHKGE